MQGRPGRGRSRPRATVRSADRGVRLFAASEPGAAVAVSGTRAADDWGVIAIAMATPAQIVVDSEGLEPVVGGTVKETIVRRATINNYEFAPRRWKDHGLVYANYHFLFCYITIR